MKTLTKLLTANDVGATGSHQVGIHIPKTGGCLHFFPQLDSSLKNPDIHIVFSDAKHRKWEFRFIHYNNKKFGGTRDEYRLLRINKFLKMHYAQKGDGLVFQRLKDGTYLVDIKKIRKNVEVDPLSTVNENNQIPYGKTIKLTFDENWNLTEHHYT